MRPMTRTSANFLLAFLNHLDQAALDRALSPEDVQGFLTNGLANGNPIPSTLARQGLVEFWKTYTPLVNGRVTGAGPMGPLGKVLRWPSWLTGDDAPDTRVARGTFALPWSALAAWYTSYAAQTTANEVAKQAAMERRAAARVGKAEAKVQRAERRAAARAAKAAKAEAKAQRMADRAAARAAKAEAMAQRIAERAAAKAAKAAEAAAAAETAATEAVPA